MSNFLCGVSCFNVRFSSGGHTLFVEPPLLFLLFVLGLALPFLNIIFGDFLSLNLSLSSTIELFYLSLPIVALADYIAIAHLWRPPTKTNQWELGVACWGSQGVAMLVAGGILFNRSMREGGEFYAVRVAMNWVYGFGAVVVYGLGGSVLVQLDKLLNGRAERRDSEEETERLHPEGDRLEV